MRQENYTFYTNFKEREDLQKYQDNALLLYSLQIRYGIDDIEEVASTSLVDGYDDKKIDLVYIDPELNDVVIAQGYYSQKDKSEAPANKASDLNTAVSWLLTRSIADLPERLRSPAEELRRRIKDKEIKRITLWYSHNLPESQNVKNELKSAENTLSAILNRHYPDSGIEAFSQEVGLNVLDDWYKGLTVPILVTETIRIENAKGYEVKESNWTCLNTVLSSDIIFGLFKDHGTNLFSANVRDYLGSRKSDSNINYGIKNTAEKEPDNFFVYNNGITALVNSYTYIDNILTIKGMSIVNGAQTTGALGSLKTKPGSKVLIPVRLIKCDNPDTIAQIVKFNNSQNKINAPDFRSSDTVQRRLIREFDLLDVIEYSSRRGGAVDVIKRTGNILPSVTVGQVLAAFHKEPGIAYNEKSKIWESDKLYATFFNDQTSAKHIIFAYSLLKTIENYKLELSQKSDCTTSEESSLKFLRSRGAIVLLMSAVSSSLEEILGKKIVNLFQLYFNDSTLSIEDCCRLWFPIVKMCLSFANQLQGGLADGIKNQTNVQSALDAFKQLIAAVRLPNETTLDAFAVKVNT
jgi:hypothetical protein